MAAQILTYDQQHAFTAVASGTITAGQIIGLDSSGTAILANPANLTRVQPIGVAAHDSATNERLLILPCCTVYDSAVTFGVGGESLYLASSGTAGTLPMTAAIGDIRPVIGYVKLSNTAVFDITPVAIKAALANAVSGADFI